MNYIRLGLALLKLVNLLLGYAERKGAISEGRRRQIADELAAIAKSTKAAGEVRKAVEAMSDSEVGDVLSS